MAGIVIYASKYGSTREYALLVAGKLGTEAVRASEVVLEAVSRATFLVLGSPVYADSVLPEMEAFLGNFVEAIKKVPLAAFIVCGDTLWNPDTGEGGHKNLEKLTRFLPSKPLASSILGGRLRMQELDEVDGPRILAFYEKTGREATGFDRMDFNKVERFAEEIKGKLKEGLSHEFQVMGDK